MSSGSPDRQPGIAAVDGLASLREPHGPQSERRAPSAERVTPRVAPPLGARAIALLLVPVVVLVAVAATWPPVTHGDAHGARRSALGMPPRIASDTAAQ